VSQGAGCSSKVPVLERLSLALLQYSGPRFSSCCLDLGGARRFRLRSSCSMMGTAAGMYSTPRLRLLGRA
jgi:hypothetical protein